MLGMVSQVWELTLGLMDLCALRNLSCSVANYKFNYHYLGDHHIYMVFLCASVCWL